MADWTELDTNGLLPGEPFTSAKALAFFENPKAIAEGAVNAPKIVSGALDMTTMGTGATTGLDRVKSILAIAVATASSSSESTVTVNATYARSSNNGASYGSSVTMAQAVARGSEFTTETNSVTGVAIIDMTGFNAITFSGTQVAAIAVEGISP
jgi:hypothetical protein